MVEANRLSPILNQVPPAARLNPFFRQATNERIRASPFAILGYADHLFSRTKIASEKPTTQISVQIVEAARDSLVIGQA